MKKLWEMRLLNSNHLDYVDSLTNLGSLIEVILIIVVLNKVTCNNTWTNTL